MGVFCLAGLPKVINHPLPFLQPPKKHRSRDTIRHYVTQFCTVSFENMLLLVATEPKGHQTDGFLNGKFFF